MQTLFSEPLVMASLTAEKTPPIAQRTIDDTTELVTGSVESHACTVELILYWKMQECLIKKF